MFSKHKLSSASLTVYALVTGCLYAPAAVYGQAPNVRTATPTSQENGDAAKKALSRLQAGEVDMYDVGLLGKTKTVEAIPYLESAFATRTDPVEKARTAQVLVQLKDSNGQYWEFLANLVQQIIDTNEPSPFAYDSQGKLIPGTSPDFAAWAKANKLGVETASVDALRAHPTEVLYLGLTEDRRAIPLLRQALDSRNFLVASEAARGLAHFQDTTAVPLMVHAAQTAPAEPAELIARWLVYFDTPEAQQAVDTLIPKERAQMYRSARAKSTELSH